MIRSFVFLVISIMVSVYGGAAEVSYGVIQANKAPVYKSLDKTDFHPTDLLDELPKGTKVMVTARLELQTGERKSIYIAAYSLDGKTFLSGYIFADDVKIIDAPVQKL
jgi:hypothetical protein